LNQKRQNWIENSQLLNGLIERDIPVDSLKRVFSKQLSGSLGREMISGLRRNIRDKNSYIRPNGLRPGICHGIVMQSKAATFVLELIFLISVKLFFPVQTRDLCIILCCSHENVSRGEN
jgi:hypothetical protein